MPYLPSKLDYASHSTETPRRVPDEREPIDPQQRERIRRAALAMQSVICVVILLLMLANVLFLSITLSTLHQLMVFLFPLFLLISSVAILVLSLGLLFIRKSDSPTWHSVVPVLGLLWCSGIVGWIVLSRT